MLKSIWSKIFGSSIEEADTFSHPCNDQLKERLQGFFSHSGIEGSERASVSTCLLIATTLREAKCCYRCVLRFLNCNSLSLYSSSREELDTAFDHLCGRTKPSKVQVCTACLGTLQYVVDDDNILIQPVLDKLASQHYQVISFNLNITLPISILHREKLLKIHVRNQLDNQKMDLNVRDLKDIYRSLSSQRLAQESSLRYDINSPFLIHCSIEHAPTDQEHLFLTQVKDPLLRIRKVKKRGQVTTIGESRESISSALKSLDPKEAVRLTTVPPLPQADKATLGAVKMTHMSTFIGGRYLKFSRECSQTPWTVGGKKLAEISVSECMVDVFKQHHQCDAVKFCTAGREDANVRMLGTGRPFYCELVNPRRPILPKEEYDQIENEINTAATSDIVRVRFIHHVPRDNLKIIKEGEERKRKTYQALIWLSEPVTQDILDRCNEVGKNEFDVAQGTPIRVFQRRGAAIRPKKIHSFSLEKVDEGADDQNSHFAVMKLNTQAGTYVKEFVHGDLGRTFPNVASIAGVKAADLIELDVMDVDLVWPPA